MEDETTETDPTPEEEIVLTEEDATSAAATVGAVLFTGAAVVGVVTVGKKVVNFGRDKIATYKAGKAEKAPTPESETPESETAGE
jgi:hypothetical protein